MSKALFLIGFQENLRHFIEIRIKDFGYGDELMVTSEHNNLSGVFSGYIDICIKNRFNISSVLAIEIEHKSSFYQASQNIQKMKAWAHRSSFRKCGFLHIFNEECNMNSDQICELVQQAKLHERSSKGFFYDFMFFNVLDGREKRRVAEELVNSKEFETRLWFMLQEAELV